MYIQQINNLSFNAKTLELNNLKYKNPFAGSSPSYRHPFLEQIDGACQNHFKELAKENKLHGLERNLMKKHPKMASVIKWFRESFFEWEKGIGIIQCRTDQCPGKKPYALG